MVGWTLGASRPDAPPVYWTTDGSDDGEAGTVMTLLANAVEKTALKRMMSLTLSMVEKLLPYSSSLRSQIRVCLDVLVSTFFKMGRFVLRQAGTQGHAGVLWQDPWANVLLMSDVSILL